MPSVEHDTLSQLFRDHPEFAVEVLRDRLGADLPTGAAVRVGDPGFTDRISREAQADTVITVGPPLDPVHGIIIEIQMDVEETKPRAWLRYANALWQQLECAIAVLVVCPDAKTAAWAVAPVITRAGGLAMTLKPAVLGPGLIPVISDPAEVANAPEMAALSVMAHGRNPSVTVAFLNGLGTFDDREHAEQYVRYAYRIAPVVVRRLMEDLMTTTDNWLAETPLGHKLSAEGEARGEARVVLGILRRRGLHVSDETRERITTCTDLDLLEEWAWRAGTVTSAEEL